MITKENYELYFFDLAEGNLTAQEVKMVEDFLHQHPELKAELDAYRSAVLDADMHVVYDNKDALKRQSAGKLFYIFNPYYSAAALFTLALGAWWILRVPQHSTVSQVQRVKDITIPLAEIKKNTVKEEISGETENLASLKKKGHSVKPPLSPQVIQQQFLTSVKMDVKQLTKADTSIIKKDVVQKHVEEQGQQRLAVVTLLPKDSSIIVEAEQKNPVAVLNQPKEVVPVSVEETSSLKERIEEKFAGWLSYLSKPKLRIHKVKEDDRTRIRIELENQRLKLMGSMKAEL